MKINRRRFLKNTALGLMTMGVTPRWLGADTGKKKPNILWIYIEDQNPWYGCYGEKLVQTPHIDALAGEGVLFERAYAPVPVCSPSRSCLITGSYPIRTGAHDHRSSRVPYAQVHLPEGSKTVPELFREAGYATFSRGKDDYNFVYDRAALYSIDPPREKGTGGKGKKPVAKTANAKPTGGKAKKSAPKKGSNATLAKGNWKGPLGGGNWRDVPEGVPFFGQYQWNGGKNPGGKQLVQMGLTPIDPVQVTVPPQYPDIPEIRQEIARHLDTMLVTDYQVKQLVGRLKADGLWDNTVIFLFSDHGSDLPRGKEFCYEEGLHVPLLVRAPGVKNVARPGTRRSDIVSTMDVGATALVLAGIDIPGYMDTRDLFAPDYHRDYVFSSADRMSNTIDRVRSVMGSRYHYIRNFMTDRSLMQWGHREMIGEAYKNVKGGRYVYFLKLREMFEKGKLTPAQAAPYGPRPAEELYDLQNDPNEVVNLATDPAYKKQLAEMQGALAGWIEDTGDKGQYPRSKESIREVVERYPENWLKGPEFTKD